ncbi:hypothetical protein RHMOL_Rhmol05G0109100 [Rhododendron molle]|uniref:Uncharacterized protein n=1 Tax=Rhododendron molle TaxID=49168 RepID=A0ACC0NMH3_RHOML|nr:hypothetical protein RHMOL_Rhmol05G0109100 [Rhododendron molle]
MELLLRSGMLLHSSIKFPLGFNLSRSCQWMHLSPFFESPKFSFHTGAVMKLPYLRRY